MAIVPCPECGEKISTKASKCIHCGCKIYECPECGAISVKKLQVCPSCGFSFKKRSELPDNTPVEMSEEEAVLLKEQRQQIDKENRVKKLKKTVDDWEKIERKNRLGWLATPFIVGICLDLVALPIVWLVWRFGDVPFHDFLGKLLIFLVGFVGVAVGVSDFAEGGGLLVPGGFKYWCDEKKLDLKNMIRNAFEAEKQPYDNVEYHRHIVATCFAIREGMYADYVRFRVRDYLEHWISLQFEIPLIFVITSFFVQNMKIYLSVARDGGFKFKMIENWSMLIIPVGIAVVYSVLYAVITSLCEKSAEKRWVSENFPEYVDEYKDYIKHVDDKVPSKKGK